MLLGCVWLLFCGVSLLAGTKEIAESGLTLIAMLIFQVKRKGERCSIVLKKELNRKKP